MKNSEFGFPSRKITVNLAPADIKKEGGIFDLSTALGIRAANDKMRRSYKGWRNSECEISGKRYICKYKDAVKRKKYCVLCGSAFETLKIAVEKFNFSARSYDEILKVSRTIANLDSSDVIKTNHIEEVVRYRFFDRV